MGRLRRERQRRELLTASESGSAEQVRRTRKLG
jgi:hypothetical protein